MKQKHAHAYKTKRNTTTYKQSKALHHRASMRYCGLEKPAEAFTGL